MPDKPSIIEESRVWREVESALRAGRAPQSLAAILPKEIARDLAMKYSRLLLCDSHTGDDGCAACRAWQEDGHPDLIVAGTGERAAKMNDSVRRVREIDLFQSDVALRPVVASRRVGYIPFADELSLPASNALLKTIEEPPPDVYILITASRDVLLPTIKSRSWNVAIGYGERTEPKPPPASAGDWASWIDATTDGTKKKKITVQDVLFEIDGWSEHLVSIGRPREAADLKSLIWFAKERHLSLSMVQDAAHIVLREGIGVEQLFGDLR